jgi:hypothetical protein
MSYSPPTQPLHVSWQASDRQAEVVGLLFASWAETTTREIYPLSIAHAFVAKPQLYPQRFVIQSPITATDWGRIWISHPDQWLAYQYKIDSGWMDAKAYSIVSGRLVVGWSESQVTVTPSGFDVLGMGPIRVLQTQFIRPQGVESFASGDNTYALLPFQYPAPEWQINASWVGKDAFSPALGHIPGAWALPSESKYVSLVGMDDAVVSGPVLELWLGYLQPVGIVAPDTGAHHMQNSAAQIKASGISALIFGTQWLWKYRQDISATGVASAVFGGSYIQGGVKTVETRGFVGSAVSNPGVINTTADQTVTPSGIAAPGLGSPTADPRFLVAKGYAAWQLGYPLVQRNPSPAGFYSSAYGAPLVDYKTKSVSPAALGGEDFGYPVVVDRTQNLFPASVTHESVFGDIRLDNTTFLVTPEGIVSLEVSNWALCENNRRILWVTGIGHHAGGSVQIYNVTPSLFPTAVTLPNSVSTAANVGFHRRYLTPPGVVQPGTGTPSLSKTPQIDPPGFAGTQGIPIIWFRQRTLEAKGVGTQAFGNTNLWFRYRYVAAKGSAADHYGALSVTHQHRTLLATDFASGAVSAPTIEAANRTLLPSGIAAFHASSHMVGGLRFLNPVGYDAALFGARIIPTIHQVYAQGFAGNYGDPTLRNATSVIYPPGFLTAGQQPADRWGTPKSHSTHHYVVLVYDSDSALNPPQWPQWTRIENRNRISRIQGYDQSVMGIPQIDNNARPLYPISGLPPASSDFNQDGMVAYRVRYLALDGLEAPYMSSWGTLHNDAFVIAPAGLNAAEQGKASVVNTRRVFSRIGNVETAVLGYPMVAQRVRELTFESRYSIQPPILHLPEVKLYTRYIDAIGGDLSGIGGVFLEIHWTLITPRWTLQNLYGYADVRNLTPELPTRGTNMEVFGAAFLRLQWRAIEATGDNAQLMGKPAIADRKRTLRHSGVSAGAVGDKLTVVALGSPPYSTQYIRLDSVTLSEGAGSQTEGGGIGIGEDGQIGVPILNQQVLYVSQVESASLFGSPLITANSIRVEPGLQERNLGEPMVTLFIRRLTVAAYGDTDVLQPSKCRVSPHTIYAVMDAPQQAIDNHQAQISLHYVDGLNKTPGTVFGTAQVTNQNREVKISNLEGAGTVSRATVELLRHYLSPPGFTSLRSGWHSIPGDLTLEHRESKDFSAFGEHEIGHGPYLGPQSIAGRGLDSFTCDAPQIALFNRSVVPAGTDTCQMGESGLNDSPFMWQNLHVGERIPNTVQGFAMQSFGEAWITARVRELQAQGFDAFLCTYELAAFDKRMRVSKPETKRASDTITPVGIYAFSSAVSDIQAAVHFIRPDGNADQFRKGAF